MDKIKERTAKVAMLTDREWELADGFIEHLIQARRAIIAAALGDQYKAEE